MNRRTAVEIAVFVLLVSAGAGLRIHLQDIPNFAPVAALALFAGFFFRRRVAALALPISVMAISDWQIDRGYPWWQMAVVYGMLALPVLLGGPLRRFVSSRRRGLGGSFASGMGLLACSLGSSTAFFTITNALCLAWYEPTLAGVLHCYAAGLPFFKYTLAGDLGFALLTFGAHEVIGLSSSFALLGADIGTKKAARSNGI